jgi:hypothetical protein
LGQLALSNKVVGHCASCQKLQAVSYTEFTRHNCKSQTDCVWQTQRLHTQRPAALQHTEEPLVGTPNTKKTGKAAQYKMKYTTNETTGCSQQHNIT